MIAKAVGKMGEAWGVIVMMARSTAIILNRQQFKGWCK